MNFPPGDNSPASPARLDYALKVLQLLFLLLALPYLAIRLFTDPRGAMRGVTRAHAGA